MNDSQKEVARMLRIYKLLMDKEDYKNLVNEFKDHYEKEDKNAAGLKTGYFRKTQLKFNKQTFLKEAGEQNGNPRRSK